MTTTPHSARRTQAERRASTRAALLQATIDCLIELGYAGTTTNEVQLRAGVSRGALTHHFASKADLLLAAMDYLYDDFNASVRSSAATLPSGEERLRPAIQMLWERFNGPLFRAAMELWVAARTDPELRTALLPHERRLGGQLRELAAELFGDQVATHPAAETVYQVLLTSMRGQAMTYALKPESSRDGPHLQNWFALVEAFTRP
ncbi:MAG TPA: TetR/AcrR family transcriptional regulator [Kineosporiaceae bacterium]|nr:TetR/AcrR family transcriptional regulator [Kineosporiaceae bacterium]